ncbi:MAG: lipopolysaccharide biosynthesis protein [Lentihominibacter sp.]|jgi:O-antigen/teichoic acid export membrane protein
MIEKYKGLFTKTNNVERSIYIWNTIAGLVVALQSAVILIVITRTNGLEDAGIFSIAFAVSSLMLFIGEFGVRKFQVSDVDEKYSFTDYYTVRIITCAGMIIASFIYVGYSLVFGNYSVLKFAILIIVCLTKVIDAYADVFYGRFQQVGRLDIAAKTSSFRVILGTAACMAALVITHNLLASVIAWFFTILITMLMSTLVVAPDFCEIKIESTFNKIKGILIACFPLFLGYFLLLYVGNAPKYAIDTCMNEVAQAKFNFIFMPVFIVGMLANFVFNPILVSLAEAWTTGKYKKFSRMVYRQIGVIGVITLVTIAGGYIIGCWLLGVIYDTDLMPLRIEMCILLIGGGMLALVNFFAVVVTVIRCQQYLTWGYLAVAIIAKALSNYLVNSYGITGASLLYTGLMSLLTIVFAITLAVCIRRRSK